MAIIRSMSSGQEIWVWPRGNLSPGITKDRLSGVSRKMIVVRSRSYRQRYHSPQLFTVMDGMRVPCVAADVSAPVQQCPGG